MSKIKDNLYNIQNGVLGHFQNFNDKVKEMEAKNQYTDGVTTIFSKNQLNK
jgi:hypothetical protein